MNNTIITIIVVLPVASDAWKTLP